jgi:diguanylate cyclase (GGDEF)-like protein
MLTVMNPSVNKNKVLYILITVLLVVQVGTFYVLVLNNRRISAQTITSDLKIGERIVKQILVDRNLQLRNVAEILAKDYGFLEAYLTAHQDQETIESVLENHRMRAKAGMIMLTGLDQKIIAQSPRQLSLPPGSELANLLRQPQGPNTLHFSSIMLGTSNQFSPQLFHVIHSPLKAPTHLADLTVGYMVDDVFLRNLREMTNLELMVISKSNQKWIVHASTLSSISLNELLPVVQSDQQAEIQSVLHDKGEYLMLASMISKEPTQNIYLVIAKPLDVAIKPFIEMERILYYLLAFTISLSVMAIYYVNKRFVEPINQQAHTDTLTGLANRRLLALMMDGSLAHFKDSKKPFTLLLLDLNKFKEINDQHGHDVGDEVLKSVAERIKDAVRTTDIVARLGGDEFAVLLQNCGKLDALKIVESISDSISKPIDLVSSVFRVKASIGITDVMLGDSLDIMIKRADEAMYAAKSAGEPYKIN